MYRVLDLYCRPYDAANPTICMDEKSKQLIADTRVPISMRPGKPQRIDHEYKRNGTRNIFVAVEPLGGKHVIKVTKRRTRKDFAVFIKELVTKIYRQAKKINLVLDNLNTHFPKSLYEAFPKEEADEILGKVNFYYTPKHASWLNMAEIEISILEEECIGRRIGSAKKLKEEITAWEKKANKEKREIKWKFTKRDAYRKMSHHYVA
jgi:hypothetical protein